ncbi:hypothetical protein PVAND_010054 [Polypedilum vanderplanki]|uniref:Transcription termination factor 2 n=1 Tax=Polypedilum vanderplanki TaxID=319348 RepID=A0A9J6CEE5_POLVA|nr:hypothetical protein PVAND_010054 [Polypedilum vanderplanki]
MKVNNHISSDSDESEYENSEDNNNTTAESSIIINESINDSNISSNIDEISNKNASSEHVEISETDEDDESKIEVSQNSFIDQNAEAIKSESENDSDSENEDDDVPLKRKATTAVNRIVDSDSSDEEVIEKRKSIYALEPEGDLSIHIEDAAYSKSTRRSIHGFEIKQEKHSIKEEPFSENEESDDESDIIISSDDDDVEEGNESEDKENLDYSGMIEKKLSSTIRSPMKENFKSELIETETSFNQTSDHESSIKKVSRASYDRIVAEKYALANRISSMKKLLEMNAGLPDGGKKLQDAIVKLEHELIEKETAIKFLLIDENESIKNSIKRSFMSESEVSDTSYSVKESSANDDYIEVKDVQPKYTGKIGLKHFEQQKALTVEKLQDIYASLDERPGEDVVSTPPKYLKIDLMRHQLHAIAFMIWRETKQKPRGGILADDMGLGKTLTVISLIMKQLQVYEDREEDEEDTDTDDDEKVEENAWIARGHKNLRAGGTLVICPASLINQWEQEIKTKIKKGALDVNVFHGPKRETHARTLAKYDVVITTYQIVVSEHKNEGCLFGIKWDRIVLDEGHVIRNYRSKQSEAVCALLGKKRWVLTGTPIQNKEFDIYAAIKFLRCNPFDDLRYWRTWIETKGGSSPRLQALLKSILLRRTKQQLQESGEIQSLPQKHFEQIYVTLNREERAVYNRIMALSKQIFAQFLDQHHQKHNNYTYDNKNLGKLHQKFAKMHQVDREIQAHEILTLLLRLRQVCCHPGLVKSMIENSDIDKDLLDKDLSGSGNDSDLDILNKLQNLKIGDSNDIEELNIAKNSEVFNFDIPSSKIEKLMSIIREKLIETDDKAIIVSQWVTYLNIIKAMLEVEGIDYCELNGTIPVKNRNDIVVDFNDASSNKKVMLLSITAGGVGLNLVGANQLYVMDPHWNPQIEQQAQDRIYRFGQKKDVKIIKFICDDTIEENILKKQQEKLELALSTLTGAKRNATKLTIDDLKDIFGMK